MSAPSYVSVQKPTRRPYMSPHLYPNTSALSVQPFKKPSKLVLNSGINSDQSAFVRILSKNERFVDPDEVRNARFDQGEAAAPGLRYYSEHDEQLTSLRHRKWQTEGIVDSIATNASVRAHVDMSNQIADLYIRKLSGSMRRKAFHGWKMYTKLHTRTRDALLQCLYLKYIGRRFYAWRFCARLAKLLRRIVKSYWKRHRRRRFMWWRAVAQWETFKLGLFRQNFDKWLHYNRYHMRIKDRWARLAHRLVSDACAALIQGAWRWHRSRLEFWAKKRIKAAVLKYFLMKVHMQRKRLDDARRRNEEAAVLDMVNKGNFYLRKLLQDRDGKVLFDIYISEVRRRHNDKPNRHLLFPSKEDMPELYFNWTLRGKAMHVLRHRCEAEVREFARSKFRGVYVPLYSCRRCDETFLFKWHKVGHIARCKGVDSKAEPLYLCWNLARPLVDAAAEPLVTRFLKREQVYAAELYGTLTPTVANIK